LNAISMAGCDNRDDISARLEKASKCAKDEQYLLGANYLEGIDPARLQSAHHHCLGEASLFKQLLGQVAHHRAEEDGWTKQGDYSQGSHDFTVFYKVDAATDRISCRIETVCHADMLVPIISVLNESELYSTWIPHWKVPKLHVRKTEKLFQRGRSTQIINIETEVQWPLATRQLILKAVACDNIDGYKKGGASPNAQGNDGGRIIIRLESLDSGCKEIPIPPARNGICRMRCNGGIVIEKANAEMATSGKEATEQNHDLITVTLIFSIDPQLRVVPQSFLNFFFRVAIGSVWCMFLRVADEVKAEERPAHLRAIREKRDLYDWIKERTRAMLLIPPMASSKSSLVNQVK